MNNISINKKKVRKIQAIQGDRSFLLCLPKEYVSNLNIKKGDYVKCTIEEEKLVVEKADF
ncbi:MAG: hypothetical protein ACPKPY_09815 [Nitrososphaeraceae archaeon]